MAKYLFADEIAPQTWAIRESREAGTLDGGWVTAYLLAGEDCAVLIDSGFGKENIREFAQELTDKPVTMCALTHGHADHSGGIRYFKTVFAEQKALPIIQRAGVVRGDAELIPITEQTRILLGGRELEIFILDSHSPGSVAYLDRKERLLFTGDNIGDRDRRANADGGMMWSAKTPDVQPSVFVFMKNVAKLLVCRDAYDRVCWGHGSDTPLDADIVESFMQAALQALSGQVDQQAEQEIDYDGSPKFQQLEYKRVSQVKNARILYDRRFLHSRGG